MGDRPTYLAGSLGRYLPNTAKDPVTCGYHTRRGLALQCLVRQGLRQRKVEHTMARSLAKEKTRLDQPATEARRMGLAYSAVRTLEAM
jgi:hypothetical protein